MLHNKLTKLNTTCWVLSSIELFINLPNVATSHDVVFNDTGHGWAAL